MTIAEVDTSNAEDMSKVVELCKLAVQYNTTKHYDNKICNCHNFTEDILRCFKLNFTVDSLEGQIGKYLSQLKTQGVSNREFYDPLTKQKHVFKTHQELDNYANELFKKISIVEFQEKYRSDYILLKAFDRALWLGKYYEDNQVTKNPERVAECADCNCPFLDPYINSM